ncbi:hypothetical protein GCM10009674_17400 [Nesterenkonia xinjiangensis]
MAAAEDDSSQLTEEELVSGGGDRNDDGFEEKSYGPQVRTEDETFDAATDVVGEDPHFGTVDDVPDDAAT